MKIARLGSLGRSRLGFAGVVAIALSKLACSDAAPTVVHSSGGKGGSASGGSTTAGVGASAGMTLGGDGGASTGAGSGGVGGDGAGGDAIVSAGTGGSPSAGTGGSGGTDNWTLPVDAKLASCVPASWTVSATTSADSNPAAYAIDGVPSTRWSSGQAQDGVTYYQVDFGGWVTLKQLVLDNSTASSADYPRGYEIRASQDGVTFPRVVASGSLAAAPENGTLTVDFDPVPTKALRIGTTQSSGNWWSIQELRLSCQGSDDGTIPNDPLLCVPADTTGEGGAGGAAPVAPAFDRANWSATASAVGPKDSIKGAFDGSVGTRWSSGGPQVGSEWYRLDLGSVGCVSSVWMVSGGGDFATSYTIEVSVDGVTYEQVAKGPGAAVLQVQFKPHSARYVRFNQVGVGSAHWWSIQELDVQP